MPVATIALRPDVHRLTVDDDVMQKKFLAAMMDRRLMSLGEKTNHSTMSVDRARLNLR
jgi:hypothetical protein